MALIKCTECGKEISDDSIYCSMCGCNVKEIKVMDEKRTIYTGQNQPVERNINYVEPGMDCKSAYYGENQGSLLKHNASEDTDKKVTKSKDKFGKAERIMIALAGITALIMVIAVGAYGVYTVVGPKGDINRASREIEKMYENGYEATPEDLFVWSMGRNASGKELYKYSPNNFTSAIVCINLANANQFEAMENVGVKIEEDYELSFMSASFDNPKLDINSLEVALKYSDDIDDARDSPYFVIYDDMDEIWNIHFWKERSSSNIYGYSEYETLIHGAPEDIIYLSRYIFATKNTDINLLADEVIDKMNK